MAQVMAVPPLPEVQDLWTLLRFLQNPDAVEQRLRQLETLRDDITELIEAVGVAKEIDQARIQARSDRQMAAEALALARKDAEKIAIEALTQAQALKVETDAKLHAAEAFRAALQAEREEFEKHATVERNNLEAAKASVEKSRAQLDAAAAEAKAQKDEYEARLAKLNAAIRG